MKNFFNGTRFQIAAVVYRDRTVAQMIAIIMTAIQQIVLLWIWSCFAANTTRMVKMKMYAQ